MMITEDAFPTPGLALRSLDPDRQRRVRGFAAHQAVAAAECRARIASAIERCGADRTALRGLLLAEYQRLIQWRANLAAREAESLGGHALTPRGAERFTMPITDENTNYDALGEIGRMRENAAWSPSQQAFVGGEPTPAWHTLRRAGDAVQARFAAEDPAGAVLQNVVHLGDGRVVHGARLLRGTAASRAADELAARIADRGLDATRLERAATYVATGREAERGLLHRAVMTLLVDVLLSPQPQRVLRRSWAKIAYWLYQAPLTKKGSDAVARVFLVAIGSVVLDDAPQLPHDVDLRAYVLPQHEFIDELSR